MNNKIDKSKVEDISELSPFQEGLLVNYLHNNSSQYSEQLFLGLKGDVDLQLFNEVWQSICDTNEALRTVFRWEGLKKPVMVLLKEHELKIDFLDFSEFDADVAEEKVAEIKKADITQGFDLTEVPFRVTLTKLAKDEFSLLISNHHILYDGWSTGIVLKEFFERYEAKNVSAKISSVQKSKYKDYVVWLKDVDKSEETAFWKKYLDNHNAVSKLPFVASSERRSTSTHAVEKSKHIFDIDKNLYASLDQFAKANSLTPASILYCCWGVLLSKFNEEDVIFGTTVSNRPTEIKGIENSVGLYINTIPLRFPNQKNEIILDLLHAVQSELQERRKFEKSSLTDIVEHHPNIKDGLFDSIVVIENYPIDQSVQSNDSTLEISEHYMDYYTHYDLSNVISTFGDKIQVTFTYDTSLFTPAIIGKIEEYFCQALKEVTTNADAKLGDINIFSNPKNQESIVESKKVYSESILSQFESQASAVPDKIAIQEEDRALSFSELNKMANGLAENFSKNGLERHDVVMLYADPSIDLVAGMLAAMKVGAAFLPISVDTPLERINFIVKDCVPKLLAGQEKFKTDIQKVQGLRGVYLIPSDQEIPKVESYRSVETGAEDLAYIIYTSGTTGNPKGVMIKNESLANYISEAVNEYVQGEDTTFPLFTSPAFDLTMTSIFTPLTSGNELIVYNGEKKNFLIEEIYEDDRANVIKLTPSHLKLLREKIKTDIKTPDVQVKKSIKRLILGGEDLKTSLAKDVVELFDGNIEIYNEYGPTEATIGCMLHKYDPENDKRASVPIGVGAMNNRIYVLNDEMEPVHEGKAGEIYISGVGLSKGYIGNEQLTAERFVDNPFEHQAKMYKTGDLAQILPDGKIEFIGRSDRQIKIDGYRIELDEIETKLLQYGKLSNEMDSFDISKATQQLVDLKRCTKCLLPENYPDISYNTEGVCNICEEFDHYKKEIEDYFRKENDFDAVAQEMRDREEEYDCLLLYSGGKDSTYVLHKLMDYGLKVLTYTFDNGYISKTAFKNIEETTSKLGIKQITIASKNMPKVFAESLKTNCSACHGCWHAINTFGTQIANEYNIKHIISGLSRGQIYDMRLEGIFETRVFEENDIEEQLAVFRKSFHSNKNKYSKLLQVSLDDDNLKGVQYVDFFRYYNTPISEIRKYLALKGWIQPKDTGFCSSNCLINDIGVYTHIKEKGYNFYTAPLSWDVRLGQTTREESMEEIVQFGSSEKHVKKVLKEIDYHGSFEIKEVVVAKQSTTDEKESLVAYFVSEIPPNISELRSFLKKELPDYMIPSQFFQIEKMPLTSNGKVDVKALPSISEMRSKLQYDYIKPSTSMEKGVSDICKEVLGFDHIGLHDNLSDIGAKSFDLTRITNKLNEAFKVKISVIALFQHTNIHAIAKYLNTQLSKNSPSTEESNGKKEGKPAVNKLAARRRLIKNKNN